MRVLFCMLKKFIHLALERAQSDARTIITFDKDFGELAYKERRNSSHGIILFRLTLTSPEYLARKISAALKSRKDWEGFFSVVEDDRIRVTPLLREIK